MTKYLKYRKWGGGLWQRRPGLPAITVPVAITEDGLPLGLQLVGPRHGDASLLAIAHVLERAAARGETVSDGLLPLQAASQHTAAKET